MANSTQHGITTVQEYIIDSQKHHPGATGEFSWLLSGITLAGKIIASRVRQAGLLDVLGAEEEGDSVNVQGEVVQKLDRIANDALMRTLGYRGNVGIIASEEDKDPRVLQQFGAQGRYIVMFDPLDGSSNIDVNVSVGTIFTILESGNWQVNVDRAVLQPGSRQVAAGYILYGSSTVLVLTTGHGVHLFTLDPMIGAFVLTRENIRIPEYAPHYSTNEAYSHNYPEGYQKFLAHTRTTHDGNGFSMRYIGSLVADFHRILLKGGVFLYPPTKLNPEGKLRLMYEANPLALVVEQAGGASTDGANRTLDIVPQALHQRTSLVIGSRKNVEEVSEFVKQG